MGLQSTYATDSDISGLDKLLGVDSVTGKTKQYPLQALYDNIEVSASNIFKTRIITITEQDGKDYIQVINEDVTGFTLQTGEVTFFIVNAFGGAYKETYVMIRPSVTVAVTYGFSETQVTTADFLILREASAVAGEVNTISSAGGSFVLAGTKTGVDLPVKGLSVGAGMSITDNGTFLTIISTITQAEINTLGSAGGGTVDLNYTKVGVQLKVKSLDTVGIKVTDTGGKVTLHVWGRDTKTANWTLSNTDDKKTIFIDNGLNDIVITVPSGLSSDFSAAFIQLGTGNVTFTPSGITILGSEFRIEGENKQVWFEKSPVGTDNFVLLGNTKV